MSQITYRANLSAKSFPFISENFGRSIIVFGQDQNFSRQLTAADDQDKDIGIPQVYYCHNVMPHSSGFQSVGYTNLFRPVTPTGSVEFSNLYILRDGSLNIAYLGITTGGAFYVSNPGGTSWDYKQTISSNLVTVAYVSGVTYIYVKNTGCYKYNFTSQALETVTLAGLVAADILGITYSSGYLIAYTSSNVAWSSSIDPTDFVPSLVSGAGGGPVESIKGAITYCIPHTLGFIVATVDNCIAALYQNNSRYPFQFREIVNSGGISSLDLVSWAANSSSIYAYTTSGLQLINTSNTQTVFPEITDFISGRYFENFDDTTNTFSTLYLSSALNKKLTVVSDRYLVMSYGVTELTHAIVYDLALKRYGKLKFTHVQCFTYKILSTSIVETPRQSLGFLTKDGSIYVVDFSIASGALNGTLILGKYQYVRSRLMQLDLIEIESTRSNQNFSLKLFTSLDGKNNNISTPDEIDSVGLQKNYACRAIGVNHSLLVQGGFILNSLVLTFNIHGKR